MDNNTFLVKWKPKHEQGLFMYFIKNTFVLILVLLPAALLFSYRNGSLDMNNFYDLARYDIAYVIFFAALNLLSWFSSEKKYKRLKEEEK